MQKSIEFHLPHYEIPQPSPRYPAVPISLPDLHDFDVRLGLNIEAGNAQGFQPTIFHS